MKASHVAWRISLVASLAVIFVHGFSRLPTFNSKAHVRPRQILATRLFSSYSSDSSEYTSSASDYESDDYPVSDVYSGPKEYEEEDDAPTIEKKPVGMSKNSGNRFVSFLWDKDLDTQGRDAWQLHDDRNELIEDHVMFCRKRNLYNETFNTDSMVDVLYSFHILSSDVVRCVGHVQIMETTELRHVHDLLAEEPITKSFLDGRSVDLVPLYRWRHIKDYTLRQDDGRFGQPAMLIAMDADPEELGGVDIRSESWNATMEYLIRSQRVIMAGPLHLPTERKDDPSSLAVGDLIMFNARTREEAIKFAEDLPSAVNGLYKSMSVHFYNSLDITGKFVSEDLTKENSLGQQMKEAMEYWGYPVDDEQTPWLNW